MQPLAMRLPKASVFRLCQDSYVMCCSVGISRPLRKSKIVKKYVEKFFFGFVYLDVSLPEELCLREVRDRQRDHLDDVGVPEVGQARTRVGQEVVAA